MPASLHARSRSGGLSDSMNQRTASAPYWSTIGSGSTVFFFDLDISSTRPTSTVSPVAVMTPFETSSGDTQLPSGAR